MWIGYFIESNYLNIKTQTSYGAQSHTTWSTANEIFNMNLILLAVQLEIFKTKRLIKPWWKIIQNQWCHLQKINLKIY